MDQHRIVYAHTMRGHRRPRKKRRTTVHTTQLAGQYPGTLKRSTATRMFVLPLPTAFFVCLIFREYQASLDKYEASVLRVQRVVRRRQAHPRGDGHGAAGFRSEGGAIRRLRSLKKWVPIVVKKWKHRRLEGANLVQTFLRDARLTQNIKAIYRFRKKVIRYVFQSLAKLLPCCSLKLFGVVCCC